MLSILLDVLVAAAMYLVPGYLLLLWADFPALRGVNRWIVALCLSLVIVPFALISVGNLIHIQANLWAWLILVIILAVGAYALKRTNRRPKVRMVSDPGSGEAASITSSRFERISVVIFIALFAAVINLPRLLMFVQGGNVMHVDPYDVDWHIPLLVSVARTGIPAYHYLYPSLHLGYYIGSWVYPAILGNLPTLSISLMRTLAMHTYIQIFAFIGMVYVLLQVNIRRPLVRLVGMAMFTVMGGFDLFASLPDTENIEYWFSRTSWLSTGLANMQISQYATMYIWVPQHLAGGMVVLLLVWLYKNLDMSLWVKLALTGVLFGFCFTTSTFVFIGLGMAAGILFIWQLPYLWRNRKLIWPKLALALALLLVVSWFPLHIYAAHESSLVYNSVRINLVEQFRDESNLTSTLDKALTMLGLPLVASVILVVDMGLAFILYLVWWVRRLSSHEKLFSSAQNALLGLQPVLSVIFIFLVMDQGGGGNLAMRSIIPAQILITLAAILTLDWLVDAVQTAGYKRYALGYLLVVFILAQSVSSLVELRNYAKNEIKIALTADCGVLATLTNSFDSSVCLQNDEWRYVYWLNNNTPRDALILEDGPFEADLIKFRWLERARLLVPSEGSQLRLSFRDSDYYSVSEWDQLAQQVPGDLDAMGWYNALDFTGKGRHPVYLVTREVQQKPAGVGAAVYQDDYVKIYDLTSLLVKP